jgi:hypothetical protein
MKHMTFVFGLLICFTANIPRAETQDYGTCHCTNCDDTLVEEWQCQSGGMCGSCYWQGFR